MQVSVGDHVRIRGIVQSDCLGVTGTVLESEPSALFGSGVKRCRIDFNGRVRRFLDIHLVRVPNGDRPRAHKA